MTDTRFADWFITINPLFDEEEGKMNWKELTDEQASEKADEVNFPTVQECIYALENLSVSDRHKNQCNVSYKLSSERGTESLIPHYHVCLVLDKATTKRQIVGSLSMSLYQVIKSPSIDVQVTHNRQAAVEYIAKNPWFVIGSVYAIGQYNSVDERRKNYIKALPSLLEVQNSPRPWQKWYKKRLKLKPDDRTIDWNIDPLGGSGKTRFAQSCSLIDPDMKAIYIQPDETYRQTKQFLCSEIKRFQAENNCFPEIIFFNLTKATNDADFQQLCKVVEDTKDNILQSGFGGQNENIVLPYIHVVVFSNQAPDLSKQSKDRWNLFWIGNASYDYLIQPVTVNPWVESFDPDSKTVEYTMQLECDLDKIPRLHEDLREDIRLFQQTRSHFPGGKGFFQNQKIRCFNDEVQLHQCPSHVKRIVKQQKFSLVKRYAESSGDYRILHQMIKAKAACVSAVNQIENSSGGN